MPKALAAQKKRSRLYVEQNGKCHWCGIDMTPTLSTNCPVPEDKKHFKESMLTLDHLNDLNNNTTREGDCVAACFKCNQKRGEISLMLRQTQDAMKKGVIPSSNCKGYL